MRESKFYDHTYKHVLHNYVITIETCEDHEYTLLYQRYGSTYRIAGIIGEGEILANYKNLPN